MDPLLFQSARIVSNFSTGTRVDVLTLLDNTTWQSLYNSVSGAVSTLGTFRYAVVTGRFRAGTVGNTTDMVVTRDLVTTPLALSGFQRVQAIYKQLNGDPDAVNPDIILTMDYHQVVARFASGGTTLNQIKTSSSALFSALQTALVASVTTLGSFRYGTAVSQFHRSDSTNSSLRVYTQLLALDNTAISDLRAKVTTHDGAVIVAAAGGGSARNRAPAAPAYTALPLEMMSRFDQAQHAPLVGRQYTCTPKFALSNWSDPADWLNANGTDKGAAPTSSDDVYVGNGVTLMVNDQSPVCRNLLVDEGGTLQHSRSANNRLTLETLNVMHHGTHDMGTAASIIPPSITAELVFSDSAIDTAADPNRSTHGYMTMGKLRACGAAKTPYVRLTADPAAGATTVALGPATVDPWDRPSTVPGGPATSLVAGSYRVSYSYLDSTGETKAGPELSFSAGPVSNPATTPVVDATFSNTLANPTVAPTVSVTGGGSTGGLLAAGTYVVGYTFVNAVGETQASPVSVSFTVVAGNRPVVTVPALPTGATSLKLYISPKASSASISDGSVLWIYRAGITGTSVTMDTASPAVSRARPPVANTATGALVAGTYQLAYTWVNAGGETLPGAAASFTAASGAIPRLTIPALPTGSRSASVYLTKPGGSTLFLYKTGVTATTVLLDVSGVVPRPAPPAVDTHLPQENPIIPPGMGAVTTGGSLAAGTYRARYSWVTPSGETNASPETAKFTITSGQVPSITLPPMPAGVTACNIYLTPPGGKTGTGALYREGVVAVVGGTMGVPAVWTTVLLNTAARVGEPAPGANTTNLSPQLRLPDMPVLATGMNVYLTSPGGVTGSGRSYKSGVLTRTTPLDLTAPAGGAAAVPSSNTTVIQGWAAGDRLAFPDSRPTSYQDVTLDKTFSPAWDVVTVTAISGDSRTVTFTPALAIDHPGSYDTDGLPMFKAHVFNLTRNVVMKSANPAGVRGHVMAMGMVDVDMRYAALKDLGRTLNHTNTAGMTFSGSPLASNSTTFDGSGNPLVLASNQIGRYPFHFHRSSGPHQPQAGGYNGTLIGNVVDGGTSRHRFRWGIVIHDTSYIYLKHNIVYNACGGAYMTEQGNEHYCVFDGNAAVRVDGSGDRLDLGVEATGFWFSGGFGNRVLNNIAAGVYSTGPYNYGFNWFGQTNSGGSFITSLTHPSYQNADSFLGGTDAATIDANGVGMQSAENNEAYGGCNVFTVWWHGTANSTIRAYTPEGRIKRMIGWNYFNCVTLLYPEYNIVHDSHIYVGNLTLLANGRGARGITVSDYNQMQVTFDNIRMYSLTGGVEISTVTSGVDQEGLNLVLPQVMRNCQFRVQIGFFEQNISSTSPLGYPSMQPRKGVVDNCICDFTAVPNPGIHQVIQRSYPNALGGGNYHTLDQLFVKNHQGVGGDDFQVFYVKQAVDDIVPTSGGTYRTDPWGAPPPGFLDPNGVAYLQNQTNLYWSQKSPDTTTPAPSGAMPNDIPFCFARELAPSKDTLTKVVGYIG